MDWINSALLLDRQLTIIVALLLSALLTGPLGWHRRLGITQTSNKLRGFIHKTERKLNRDNRSAGKRVYRGIILTLFLSFSAFFIGWALHRLSQFWPYAAYIEIMLLTALLPVRHLFDQARQVGLLTHGKQLTQAKAFAHGIARRDLSKADEHGLYRLAIEYVMKQMCSKILAPILAFLLCGISGALLVRIIGLLDAQVGHAAPRYRAFGWSAAKLDDLLQWLPARIGALFILVAAFFVPRCKPHKAITAWLKTRRTTESPNSGWPLSVTAGALNIALGGPRHLADYTIADGWLGQGTAKATYHDLQRGLWLYATVMILLLMGLGASLAFVN